MVSRPFAFSIEDFRRRLEAVVNEAEAFCGIGTALLPVRKTVGFRNISLGEGSGDEDIVQVWNCLGGDEDRIMMGCEDIFTRENWCRARVVKKRRSDSVRIGRSHPERLVNSDSCGCDALLHDVEVVNKTLNRGQFPQSRVTHA